MNSRQRRVARRASGVRPPYQCMWCGAINPGIGVCVGCGTSIKPLGELNLRDLATKGWERGYRFDFKITPLAEGEQPTVDAEAPRPRISISLEKDGPTPEAGPGDLP